MKHQVFFFLSIFSFSLQGMCYDLSNVTKSQLINEFTELNAYMKKNHADSFDTKRFGLFIIALRETDRNVFEDRKKELFALMRPISDSIDMRNIS